MIVSWISHDNRRRRRANQAKARIRSKNAAKSKASATGTAPSIHRVTSQQVTDHIVTLTTYLTTPSPERLRALAEIEAPDMHVVRYIGSDKSHAEVEELDAESVFDIAQRERVAQIMTRNLLSHELKDIQLEMAVVASMSPGSEDPVEHLVLSWQAGEHALPEQVEEALDIVLDVSGLTRHQAYAVLHRDTDNDHLHIAVNRVDPVTGERVQVGRDIDRSIETLHQAIAILEHRQGWAPQDEALYRADETGCYDRGTNIKVRDARLLPCASSADRAAVREWRAERAMHEKVSEAARQFEIRTGLESLQRRVIETAAPILREAHSWDDVHRGLAAEGMRYRVLTSGAVIACGDREIAASTAWGGASAAKMTARIGAHEPAAEDVAPVPFEDRIMCKLFEAQKRRALLELRREQTSMREAVAYGLARTGDRYRKLFSEDPLADTSALNDVRARASAETASLRQALEQLEVQRRERIRRKRAALKKQRETKPPEVEEDPEAPVGMVIGHNAASVPLVDDDWAAAHGYRAFEVNDRRDYYRAATLIFSEHRDRIDLYDVDDDAIRAALRLGQAKWGEVVAIGDRRFVERLARLAVEEGVTLANPEVQQLMSELHAARASRLAEERVGVEAAPPSDTVVATVETAPVDHTAVLERYSPRIQAWVTARDDDGVQLTRLGAMAFALTIDPAIRQQLAELEGQQFDFAIELRRWARRYGKHLDAMHSQHQAQWADEPPTANPDRVPELKHAPSADDVAAFNVQFAPVQVEVPVPIAAAVPPPPAVSTPSLDPAEQRLRDHAARVRVRDEERFAKERAEALRARVGHASALPRPVARLLLWEHGRRAPSRTTRAGEPDRRERDLHALSADPVFADLLERVRSGDQALLADLSRMDRDGDTLGRVPLKGGRLDFSHRSPNGHDEGAQPPLEWMNENLKRVDWFSIRLTRSRNGIGLADRDLLDTLHHNHVALLYPDIQARLEVAWRVQRERDEAILYKVQEGTITLEATIDESGGYGSRTSFGVPRNADHVEQRHLKAMSQDAEAFIRMRQVQRGELTIAQPLHTSPLVAAFLRARDEKASEAIVQLLRIQARQIAPDVVPSRAAPPLRAPSHGGPRSRLPRSPPLTNDRRGR